MSFTTITKCNSCLREFTDSSWQEHDCRIRQQIEDARREQREWDKKFEYWDEQQERLGIKRAQMGVYEVKVRDRAVEGKCVLVNRDYCEPGKPYVSRVLNNPTWATVLKRFDDSLEVTQDYHHCFLEGIEEISSSSLCITRDLPEGCRVFLFFRGS